MAESIRTGGGAYIGQSVTAGTFVGRDQIVLIAGYGAEQLQTVLPRLREALADPETALSADPSGERIAVTARGRRPSHCPSRRRLTCFRRQHARGTSGAISRHSRSTRAMAGADIPPEFAELEVIGEGPQRQLRRVRLEDITDAVRRHPALALLGEPGSGKTTTLHRLLLAAARLRLTGQGGLLPVLLPLAEYRDYPSPHAFLQARWAQSMGALDPAEHLRRGDLLLLCDALNEMPFRDGRDYRDRIGAWRQFVKDWPGNRLVFTCRSRDYSEPLGLPQVEIERLDDPRIEDFLGRYLASAQAQETWARLRGSPLLDLARNPYYLTMLAWLVAQRGTWPASRAGLFQGFTDLLLEREQSRNHPDWPGKQPLLTALSVLAETMQAQGEGTRLPRGEVLGRIPAQADCGSIAVRNRVGRARGTLRSWPGRSQATCIMVREVGACQTVKTHRTASADQPRGRHLRSGSREHRPRSCCSPVFCRDPAVRPACPLRLHSLRAVACAGLPTGGFGNTIERYSSPRGLSARLTILDGQSPRHLRART